MRKKNKDCCNVHMSDFLMNNICGCCWCCCFFLYISVCILILILNLFETFHGNEEMNEKMKEEEEEKVKLSQIILHKNSMFRNTRSRH